MGRSATGIETTWSSRRLDLKFLFKNGYLQKNKTLSGKIEWNKDGVPSGSVSFKSVMSNDESYIQLKYVHTKGENKTDLDYKIYLLKIPSNLGKGFRYYFICPISGKRAKILYSAYGSLYFKHREEYKDRIYYEGQNDSKSFRDASSYRIGKLLDDLYKKQKKSHYRGLPTKLLLRIKRVEFRNRKYQFKFDKIMTSF